MAKRGILTHPKTLRLAERLGIADCYAVGILECLWQWVAEYAPTGDLSDCSAREIARAIGFRGKPASLLAALVAVRLIDDLGGGKLLVHDWSDHAPDYVHMRLARARRVFATGAAPSLARLPRREREEIEKSTGLADSVRSMSAQEAHIERTQSAPPEPGQNQARPEPGQNQNPPSPPGGSVVTAKAEDPEVEMVYAGWMQRSRTIPTAEKVALAIRKRIRQRLAEKFTPEQLLACVDFALRDEFYRSKRYAKQPDVIWRDASRVHDLLERIPENGNNGAGRKPAPSLLRQHSEASDLFVAMGDEVAE